MKRWFAVSALLVIVLASIWAVNSYSSAFVKSSASLKVTDSSDSGALISVTPVKKKLTVQIGVATEIFKIKNNMGHAITYTLESEKLSPPSGDLQPGEETVISINLDEESKPGAATFETTLQANWNGGSCRLTITVPLEIKGETGGGKKQASVKTETQSSEKGQGAVQPEGNSQVGTGDAGNTGNTGNNGHNDGLNTGDANGDEGSGLNQDSQGQEQQKQDDNAGSGSGGSAAEDPPTDGQGSDSPEE
ncbi:MAG TPA: hypothetical protein PKO38_03465 [Bacillota bacterium]|jgi:hypothetical protein|nr:hypothetical protein [Bacillota bacterium]HPT33619.1 hypothetical protein [Bacillota bacterium]